MPSPDACTKLPRIVDGPRFCQQGARVSGVIDLAELERLAGAIGAATGQVEADIAFRIDEQQRRILSGEVRSDVPLVCQRCLEVMSYPVEAGFELALVWNDEQAAQLPRSLDAVVVEGNDLDLYRIVEDEILLALPLVAHHPQGSCSPPAQAVETGVEDSGEVVVKKENPFQVLASLKTAGQARPESED